MTNVDVIPPGLYEVDGPLMNAGMSLVLEPAIAFTDAGGNYWLRDADGTLSELDRDPYVEYGDAGRTVSGETSSAVLLRMCPPGLFSYRRSRLAMRDSPHGGRCPAPASSIG